MASFEPQANNSTNMMRSRTIRAERMNIAYREMLRRGIEKSEALILCEDQSIVDAYVNARAGVKPAPSR
jgi:hypothetical protein